MKAMLPVLLASLSLSVVAAGKAGAQSITQDVVIDADFPVGEPLEKVADYFASRAFPSVIVGNGRGGIYLYRSTSHKMEGPWVRSTITKKGGAYERMRAVKFPGDAYPGIIASIGNKIIWFDNPGNHGNIAGVTRQWPRRVINPDHGCHDIRLEDLDGDGRIDVICSGAISLGAPEFVAFQNDPRHWQLVYNVADVGDDIAVIRIGTDPTPHLVGADHSGGVFWYENPRLTGGNARTANWVKHYIGPGNVGNSFAAGRISSMKDDVITAANEHEGPGGTTDARGITWYEQPDDPGAAWIAHDVASSYRDVHEINLGDWQDGTPYFLVAEQEQACDPARPEGRPPTHPGIPCRIAMFQWTHGELRETVLANASTQNQAILPWHGGLLMADANHGVYGGSRAIHVRVIMP
ncbi:MAG: repeat protein [Gammaproteobacteria bacterium]|nr:repeat protein [Gammaproteobacteria bacterium]